MINQPGFNFKISFFFSFWFFFFFFVCVCVCACSVAKLCLTSCDPMDCSPPGSSMHGLLLARILEWVAISSFRRSFQPRDGMHISCVSYIASKYNLVLPLYLSSWGGEKLAIWRYITMYHIHLYAALRKEGDFSLQVWNPFQYFRITSHTQSKQNSLTPYEADFS